MAVANIDPHISAADKVWVPLENNADVMTKLAHQLGLSSDLEFQDVYSLTDEELLSFVPRPIHALLFIYPCTDKSEAAFKEEHDSMDQYFGRGAGEPVLWIRQTIGNVCGLMGTLHCVLNGEAANHIKEGSWLDNFRREALPAYPDERAKLLYDSKELEEIYKEAAIRGDSNVPDAMDPVLYAFVAWVRGKDGHLYEMEGRHKGPVDRGIVEPDEDLLSERVLGLSAFPHINRERVDEARFSCIALVNAQ